MKPTIGILAVQGAFIEHERALLRLGCTCIELRQAADVCKNFDALVLPGGESTAQRKLLHELGMFDNLKRRITEGMPVLGTCAGLILLAERLENDNAEAGAGAEGTARTHARSEADANAGMSAGADAARSANAESVVDGDVRVNAGSGLGAAPHSVAYPGFGTLPVTVRRNAYGRQLGSFHTEADFAKIGRVPMTFIRAPFIASAAAEDVLAQVDGNIVAVKHDNQIGVAFHPELDADNRIHRFFLSLIK